MKTLKPLLYIALIIILGWPSVGEAVISVRTTANGSGAGTGTAVGTTATEPSGCTSGDLMIAIVHKDGGAGGALTRPSGWTNLYNGASNETQFRYDVSYIVRGGSAPALNWTWTGSAYYEYIVLCLSGQHATPIDNSGSFSTNFSGTPDPASITPNTSDAMAIVFGLTWSGSGSGGLTAPASYTRVYSATGWNSGMAYRQLASGSAEDAGTWGNASGTGSNIGQGVITIATGAGGGGGATLRLLPMLGVGQ